MREIELAPGSLETDAVEVRSLRPDDLEWVVRIDANMARSSAESTIA
jgi:hypothetical protein